MSWAAARRMGVYHPVSFQLIQSGGGVGDGCAGSSSTVSGRSSRTGFGGDDDGAR
ncbi:hypothetical protein B005_2852 [Nocardiopsis alba ATCC BAA-2165]|uniref:Uncharacterized protein n=1 Tax=Nocardiopsis alba (strain ATCC BAA-2165 / BE74) TaxID=1205910 RepID=J7LCJ5_NOCAA|nr:hypothetical protein B005_2852 [Nocardiopsis alba ATCC BAA-2165]